eukprot:3528582-Prymnesium_polylepis.2
MSTVWLGAGAIKMDILLTLKRPSHALWTGRAFPLVPLVPLPLVGLGVTGRDAGRDAGRDPPVPDRSIRDNATRTVVRREQNCELKIDVLSMPDNALSALPLATTCRCVSYM